MTYHNMSTEKVNSVHTLFKFLRALHVLGVIETVVSAHSMSEFGKPRLYSMKIIKYSPGVYETADDKALMVFTRLGFFDGPSTPDEE